jgi:hypothetical protein
MYRFNIRQIGSTPRAIIYHSLFTLVLRIILSIPVFLFTNQLKTAQE